MLTGGVPYEGESSQEIIMKHLTADPNLGELREPYASVIRKSLAKDPERRFRSVPEMTAAINGHSPLPRVAESRPAADVPPIQPMFIGEQTQYAGDDEIKFGELRQVVEADISTGPATAPRRDVEVISSRHAAPDEPIARAVHGGWHKTMDWWATANLTTPVKILILAGLGMLLLVNAAWLFPVSLGLGMLYLIYFTIRSLITPSPEKTKKPKVTRAERMNQLPVGLATKPVSDRITETIGSLVVASIVCIVLAFFTLIVTNDTGLSQPEQWAFYTWSVVTAIVASWTLVIMNKTWEHRKGDAIVRRFVMLSAGVVVGLAAFFTAQYLHLNWASDTLYESTNLSPFADETFLVGNAPNMLGFIVFFSGLFVILRWWRQADPVRRTRLSIWSVGLCLVWGMLIGEFFHFPMPWSIVVAVMISIATQMASPWLTREQRQELQHRAQTA
ncbi:MAG: hypothetical protein ACR2NP_07525, partial [Pirellulaceae bacterium]